MINAGKYNKRIQICSRIVRTENGYQKAEAWRTVIMPYASVKTTKGMALIAAGSDFEKAYTNFTIRYPSTLITRDMRVRFRNRDYSIEYINNVNEEGVELELQCKEITH